METNLRHREGTIWRGSPVLVMALALMSLAVFTWGLQYKLSLYKASEQAKPTIPAAKLLSQKERPAVAVQVQHALPYSGLSPITLLPAWSTVFLLCLTCISILPLPLEPCRTRKRWRTAQIYSKPPPASL